MEGWLRLETCVQARQALSALCAQPRTRLDSLLCRLRKACSCQHLKALCLGQVHKHHTLPTQAAVTESIQIAHTCRPCAEVPELMLPDHALLVAV